MKKYKKDAIVVLVIGAIMMIALVLMTYEGVNEVVIVGFKGFTSLC